MFSQKKHSVPKKTYIVCMLILLACPLLFSSIVYAQDEHVIERYKLMLSRNPKEGSTFDRLYQFYLEGAGLDAMLADYRAAAQADPNNSSIQLILGHIYKRLGRDAETVTAYQRAVTLGREANAYYPHFALGQMFATLRQHEDAIRELTKAAELSEQTQAASPEELMKIYKALGRAYFSRDQIDAAITAWKKIPELDPENIFARIELADLFREQHLYEQAIAQHEAIIQRKTDDPYRVCLSRREIGNIQNEQGNYEAALQSYDAAIALTAPGNWLRKDLQHRVIGIYAADGNWEGLITYYQQKLESTPNAPEWIGLLAAAYLENEEIDEGITAYQNAVALAPTDTRMRLNLIAALRNAERLEEAAATTETLLEQNADDFGIYRELGELYLQLGDESKARTTYQRMLNRDPENASTHLTLARIYAGNQWTDDAIAAYQKAHTLQPDTLETLQDFGEFYYRQGNRQKTVETWNLMVSGDKAIPENYDRLAQLLDAKDFHAEALAASRKAVALAPDAYRYRETLAKRLTANKHYDEALTAYAEAAKLAPTPFFAQQMTDAQIDIYRQQGTLVEKIEALETALEKAPPTQIHEADVFAQHEHLAKMYLKLGNRTSAIEVLLRAKALHPDDVPLNRTLAEVYTQQGLRKDAERIYTHLIAVDSANAREYAANIARAALDAMDFQTATDAAKHAIAQSPRNPEGHQMLAQISKHLGNYETAIDSLKHAIRLRPEATDVRSELADIYTLTGNHRQAIEQYWQCWELTPNITDKLAYVNPLAEAYYDLGRRAEFEEKLIHKSKTGTSVGPVVALAELYQKEGDLPSARFQLARALDRDRENPDLLAQLVKVSLDLGDTQEALAYQERLTKAQPDPSHQQRLGELLFDLGREQEAIQVWTKLLHAKNQPLDADIKLSALLIRHGLLDEALSVLDRAAEKVTGPNAHIALYQIGTAFINMNELDRALPHFQRILDMPKPPPDARNIQNVTASSTTYTYGWAGGVPNTHKFLMPRSLLYNIQSHSGRHSHGQPWIPQNVEEAQAGAVVQLTLIAQQQHKLTQLIEQYEAAADASPQNIQTLETLAQIYLLTENHDKTAATLERLLAAAPNDPIYQRLQLDLALQQNLRGGGENFNSETLQKRLDQITGLTAEERLWYIAMYTSLFYHRGQKADAQKLVAVLEGAVVTDLYTGSMLVNTLLQMNRIDAAEKILAQLPVPVFSQNYQTRGASAGGATRQPVQWQHYSFMSRNLAIAYIRAGKIDKGIEHFWNFFERTKPILTQGRRRSVAWTGGTSTSHSYSSGYTPTQAGYPSPSIYYNQDRLTYLQEVFSLFSRSTQQDALYAKLRAEFAAAKGPARITPGLALSYCYWWDSQREKALEVAVDLQKEFPDDLTLKLNTLFAAIQTGEHATALTGLKELADEDVRNRRQYYDLMLQLASHTGDTVTVRELITKILNSPIGVRELHQFSQKLQQNGHTQYAIAVAKKTATLAMGQRDPNFLMELSQHLVNLGRGTDAARIAEHALRFAMQRDRYGQMLSSWHFQQASRMVGSKGIKAREPQLIEAVEKDPHSFQAHIRLARFYENTNQHKKASDAYKAALSLRPKDSMTRQQYAQMLQQSGQAKAAVTQYITLLKQNPSALNYNSWQVIETFFEAGEVDELVSLAKEMIVPSVGRHFSNQFALTTARQCIENNNPKAAVELYEKIVAVYPNQTYTYRDLAAAYAAAGEPEKAIQFLREKVASEETQLMQDPYAQVQIVSKLIELYKASDRLPELITEYEAKLTENPEWAGGALLYLLASMKIAANDLEGSDTLVNRLLDEAQSTQTEWTRAAVNTQWFSSLADAYRAANDPDRELRLLTSTIANIDTLYPWPLSDIFEKLGNVYARKGEKENAQDAFRKMGTHRLLQRGGNPHEKEQVIAIYMQHEMWDDAEVLLTGILNDFTTQRWTRDQAQRQLMEIQRRRDGVTTTIDGDVSGETSQKFNLGTQRALAQEHVRQGEVQKAIHIYEHIEKIMPEDFESRAQLATLYSRQDKHEKAISVYKALLEADPENTKYQDGLVKTYQAAGRTDEAHELAQHYIETDPESPIHSIRLAKFYASDEQVDAAIDTYKKAIDLGPGDGQAYRELAKLFLQKDDLEAAEKAFKDAIQHTPQEWERQNIERQLMDLYRRQGTLEQMFTQAEEAGTLTLAMQRQRAQDYHNAGNLEAAIEAYKKALDMTQHNHERRELSGQLLTLYARIGEKDLAIELYETLSRHRSGMTRHHGASGVKILLSGDETREILINAYKKQGKLEELRITFQNKLDSDPENPVILEMLAEIYRNAHNHQKAAETYQTLTKVQPGNVRSFYYAAAAFHKSNQPEVAKELLNSGKAALSASNRSQDEWFLTALATICAGSDMHAAALQLCQDALAAGGRGYGGYMSTETYIYEILGKSYLGLKRYEEAVTAYEQMANTTRRHDQRRRIAEAAIHLAYKEGNLYQKQILEQSQKIEENPDDIDTHYALAQTLEASGQVDQALAQYEKMRELQPDNVQWYQKIGDLWMGGAKLGDERDPVAEARTAYQKAIEFQPTSTHLYELLARTYTKAERLAEARTLYEKAIELQPNLYHFYSLLAQTYVREKRLADAEAVYWRAFAADLQQHEYEWLLRSLYKLYAGEDQKHLRIAVLEEFKSTWITKKGKPNLLLFELLGDAYKDAGDPEKAEEAYTVWLDIRQKEVDPQQRAWAYGNLANELLRKDIMPERAVALAKRAAQTSTNWYDWHAPSTLGHAYIANGQYEEALAQFKRSLSASRAVSFESSTTQEVWSRIAQAGKNAADAERYAQIVHQLASTFSGQPNVELHANTTLAQFYHDRDPEKAKAYMDKTAFIPESTWWIIGPFDNTGGIGYNTVYIPEDATHFDITAEYDGLANQVRWKKQADWTFDGRVNFYEIFGKNVSTDTAYAWRTLHSPDERKAQLHFGRGGKAKLWVNGEAVFTPSDLHTSSSVAQDTIPITLKAGQNSILVKVCAEGGWLGFSLRLTDMDGDPFADVILTEEPTNE